MLRVLCVRVGDAGQAKHGSGNVRVCSRCRAQVWINRETIHRVGDLPHEICCLECNQDDPRAKNVCDFRKGRIFELPPDGGTA